MITSLEQIRLKPCGDGERAAWTDGSQVQVLYEASLIHFSMSARPLVGGVCASDTPGPFESLEPQAANVPSKPRDSATSLISSSRLESRAGGTRDAYVVVAAAVTVDGPR